MGRGTAKAVPPVRELDCVVSYGYPAIGERGGPLEVEGGGVDEGGDQVERLGGCAQRGCIEGGGALIGRRGFGCGWWHGVWCEREIMQ